MCGVPESFPAFTVEEVLEAYDKLNCQTVVVKAQIHAGGRGKGGGVKLAHTKEEVKKLAENILEMNLVTHQTGPEGKKVQRLLIESGNQYPKRILCRHCTGSCKKTVCIYGFQLKAVWKLKKLLLRLLKKS